MTDLLGSIGEVVVAFDNEWQYTYFNPHAERALGKTADEVLGRTIWDAFPERESKALHPKLIEAKVTRTPQSFDHQVNPGGTWYHVRAYPHAEGMTVISLDVTNEKREHEEHIVQDALKDRSARELELAVKAKDRFIAQVSHELRTPLTPALINLGLLQELLEGDLDASLLVDMIRRNLQHEVRLIDDLLDITRLSNGKLRLQHGSVDTHAVIANVVSLTKPAQLEKGINVTLTLLAKNDKLWADEMRIQQILWNLLQNAIKFSPDGSTVKIKSVTRSEYIVITVQDEGMGIEPHKLARIFDPFEQTDAHVTQRFGGLGLGLAITRSLVHLHGGYITAHSEGVQKGTTFRVQLPLKSEVADDHAQPEIYPDVVGYSHTHTEPSVEQA